MAESAARGESPAQALRACLAAHRIRDCRLVVAVSGGADSVALLHLLLGQREELALDLHVAHLDHRLRGAESARDAEFVRRLAAGLGLPATIAARDVEAWRRAHRGGSLEAAARAVRLGFLEEVAEEVGAAWVVLGHTADDQAETVLLNLVRGAGLAGLRGMRVLRGRFLRPVLGVRRDALRRLLDERGLPFRTDSSNLSLEPRRNRMRAEVMPLLAERFNPRAVTSIARGAAILGRLDAWLSEAAEGVLAEAAVSSAADRVELDLAPLREAAGPIRERAAQLAVEGLGTAGELAAEHVEALARLLGGTAAGRLQLPGGLIAAAAGDRLTIGPGEAADSSGEWVIEVRVPGEVVLPGGGRRLVLEVLERPAGLPEEPRTEPHECYMDFDRLGSEVQVRNRRPGDRVHLLGAPGSRKLKEFLIDEKVPAAARAAVPLLVDELGIACVLGHRIGERMKVTPRTRRLLHARLLQRR